VFLERDRPKRRWAIYRREGRDRLLAYFASEREPITDTGMFEYARSPGAS
jgi:hypothetical protein